MHGLHAFRSQETKLFGTPSSFLLLHIVPRRPCLFSVVTSTKRYYVIPIAPPGLQPDEFRTYTYLPSEYGLAMRN